MRKIFIEEKSYQRIDFAQLPETFIDLSVSNGILTVDSNRIKFTYVGLVVHAECAVYVLPKYYNDADGLGNCKDLTVFYNRILSKMKRLQSFGFNNRTSDFRESAIFSIYIDLLDYYSEYGIYAPVKLKASNSFEHAVNWSSTVESYHPLYVGGIPLYVDVVSSRKDLDYTHLISELQKYAIVTAFEEFGTYLGDYVVDVSTDFNIEDHELTFLKYVVSRQLSETYIDNEIHLLNLLSEFIDGLSEKTKNDYQLFGTTAFYNVWEVACRSIIRQTEHLHSFFAPATWIKDNVVYKGSGKPIPDILKLSDNVIYIFDAKYYTPEFKNGNAKNEPGTESLGKQVLYELIIRNHADFNPQCLIYNAFILPAPVDNTRTLLKVIDGRYVLGKVNYNNVSLPEINLIFLPPVQLFNSFLEGAVAVVNL